MISATIRIKQDIKNVTYLDTFALGQADPRLLLTNDKNVTLTGSEGVVDSILDVNNIESAVMAFSVRDDTNTTHVSASCSHCDDTRVKLDEVGDFASSNVNLDGVVDLDGRIRIADTGD